MAVQPPLVSYNTLYSQLSSSHSGPRYGHGILMPGQHLPPTLLDGRCRYRATLFSPHRGEFWGPGERVLHGARALRVCLCSPLFPGRRGSRRWGGEGQAGLAAAAQPKAISETHSRRLGDPRTPRRIIQPRRRCPCTAGRLSREKEKRQSNAQEERYRGSVLCRSIQAPPRVQGPSLAHHTRR